MTSSFLRHAAVITSVLAVGGCWSTPEPVDLLSLEFGQPADEVLDQEHDQIIAMTDTLQAAGTLNLLVRQSDRFTFAGVPLIYKDDPDYLENPDIMFLFYSETVMEEIAQRIASGLGGASFSIKARPEQPVSFAERLKTLGALDALIGIAVTYHDEEFLAQIDTNLSERFGQGTPIEHIDDGTFWKDGGRYIMFAAEYGILGIYPDAQAWNGCLYAGPIGVVDVGGCDREGHAAEWPTNMRKRPDL
ncbi:hypothetical protein [Litoreibacter roseus]|nr:hypothetical protein [Litoreibacter roseus]